MLLAVNGMARSIELMFQSLVFGAADMAAGHTVTRLMVADAGIAQPHTVSFAPRQLAAFHALLDALMLFFQA